MRDSIDDFAEKSIYIAGAHSRAQTFKEYVTYLYPKTTVVAYLVDEPSENESATDAVPVIKIDESSNLNIDYPVYIATRGVYHKKIAEELRALGMKYIYPVDFALDSRLRNKYVEKQFALNNRRFLKVGDEAGTGAVHARIYVVQSVYDEELSSAYDLLPDEAIIQAGTALTEKRLNNAAVFDNQGENISHRNKQFCELTALYWMWKNARQDVVGLVHYRRHFLLPDNWLDWLQCHYVDVILPVPLYVFPSIEENYKSRHSGEVWDCMMKYLRDNLPDDYEPANKFFETGLYSPCNMFIMRKEVLDELCAWLFPVLEAVTDLVGEKEASYQNRYPGFLSERLMTYFFEKNRTRYKVAYADKNFLQ